MDNNYERPLPKPGEIYRHFKGSMYQIITLATKEDSGDKLVIYQALYGDFGVWARNLDVFMSRIDAVKYPEAKQQFRFELIKSASDNEVHEKCEAAEAAKECAEAEQRLDPLLEEFLDADYIEDKMMILQRMHDIINDSMIDTMAAAMDVEIEEGPVEDRYNDLLGCLGTISRYEIEGRRLR